ncbi:hypothetical protein HK405_004584 [Cladochytrium tenue]|nr:hypothetical protein HK405_004584 [Cladochytrium tenue]
MAATVTKLAGGTINLAAAVAVLAPIALSPSPLLNAARRRPSIRTPTHSAPNRASAAYAASYSSSAGATAADDDAQLYLVLANPRAVNTLNAAMKLKRRALTAEEADAAATLLGLPASSVYAYVRRHAASKLPMQRVQSSGGHVPQRSRAAAADAGVAADVQPLPLKHKAPPLSLLRRATFTEDEDMRILAYAAQKRVAAAVAAGIPRTLPATSTDPAAPAASMPNPAFLDAICPVSPSTGGQRAVSLHDLELELNGARRRRAFAASNTAAAPRQANPVGAGEPLPPQETRPVSRDELNARLIDLECGLAPGSRLKTWKLTPDELARVRRGVAAARLAHAARATAGAGPAASPALVGILRSFEPLAAAPQPHDPAALPGLETAGPLFLRAWTPTAVDEAQCRAVGSIVGERPDAAMPASPPLPPPRATELPALTTVATAPAGADVVNDPTSGAGPAEPSAAAVESYSDDPYDTDLSSYLILYGPLPKVGLSFSPRPPTRFEDALRNSWSTTDPPDYEGTERGRAFWIAVLNATSAADLTAATSAPTATTAASPALPASGRPLLGRTWQQCRQGWTERLWSREEDTALRWLVGVAYGLVHPGDVPMTRRAVDRVFAEMAHHPALRPRPDGRDLLSERSPLWQDVARYGRVRGRPLKNMAFRWQFLVRTGEVFGRSGGPATATAAASVAETTAGLSSPAATEVAETSTKSDAGAPA